MELTRRGDLGVLTPRDETRLSLRGNTPPRYFPYASSNKVDLAAAVLLLRDNDEGDDDDDETQPSLQGNQKGTQEIPEQNKDAGFHFVPSPASPVFCVLFLQQHAGNETTDGAAVHSLNSEPSDVSLHSRVLSPQSEPNQLVNLLLLLQTSNKTVVSSANMLR